MILGWIITLPVVAGISASASVSLFSTRESIISAGQGINLSQALVALFGRVYDVASIGAVSTIKLVGFGAVFVALFCSTLVVRHTRGDEEAGRRELVGSARVAREAPVVAALIVLTGAIVILAVATVIALVVGKLPFDGSVTFALGWAGCGLFFGALAAFAAQLSITSRGANMISVGVIAVAYVLRAIGDVASGPWQWIRWLSPFAWSQQMRPYASDRWWPLALLIVGALVIALSAVRIESQRDIGLGLIAQRPGPARASRALRSPLSLTWRLHGGATWAWLFGFAFYGAITGVLTLSVHTFLNSKTAIEFIKRLGGLRGVTDAFLVVEFRYAAMIVAAFSIQAMLRLHTGEVDGHAEKVLANPISRWRYCAGDLTMSLAGSIALLVTMGLAAGAAYALSAHHAVELPRLLAAAAVEIPAVWLIAGAALLVVAYLPHLTATAWALLAGVVVLGEVGPLLKLNHWVLDLSPFTHISKLPGGTVEWTSLLVILALALGAVGLGLVGFRRRDLDVH